MNCFTQKNIQQRVKFKGGLSFYTILVVFVSCVATAHLTKSWIGNTPFMYDAKQYNAYLPKLFIVHDIDFNIEGDFWLNHLPNGKPFLKFTCGVALLEAPFFFIAYGFSNLFNIPVEEGYSKVFVECIHYGVFIYFLIGLFCLRRILKCFQYSETVISCTILATLFGTNLFNYVFSEGLMSHGFLFSLHCMFLYLIIRFYDKPGLGISLLLGIVGGLITLIRPTEVLCFFIWALWAVNSTQAFKKRMAFLFSNFKLIFAIVISFCVVWIPQFMYWYRVSGHLIMDAYVGEKMFFSDPKIFSILFSPRNGLFLYCPVMILYFVALFFPNPQFKGKLIFSIFIILNIYIASCWWCWWYGGAFSMRALIHLYPYLAISFAGMLQYIYQNATQSKKLKRFVNSLIFVLVALHLKFWFQHKTGFIHYDSMTMKSYLFILPRVELNGEEAAIYTSYLQPPNYQDALKGIR